VPTTARDRHVGDVDRSAMGATRHRRPVTRRAGSPAGSPSTPAPPQTPASAAAHQHRRAPGAGIRVNVDRALDPTDIGILRSLEHRIATVDEQITRARADLDSIAQTRADAERGLDAPFKHRDALQTARARPTASTRPSRARPNRKDPHRPPQRRQSTPARTPAPHHRAAPAPLCAEPQRAPASAQAAPRPLRPPGGLRGCRGPPSLNRLCRSVPCGVPYPPSLRSVRYHPPGTALRRRYRHSAPPAENVNLIWDRVVTLNGDHPSSSQMCDDVVSDGLLSCGPVGVDRGQ
jgi:hypothetical protein